MTDDDIIAAILEAGVDDWVMLTEVLWEAARDERTPESKETVRRVLGRLFEDGLMVPGDLGATGFEAWDGTSKRWLRSAIDALDRLGWKPMGDGFWLRLTEHGEHLAQDFSRGDLTGGVHRCRSL